MNQEALNYQREGNEVPNDTSPPSSSSSGGDLISGLLYTLTKWALILVALVLCSPALFAVIIIVSWSYYYLTRKKMMQASEVGLYMGGTALVGLALWFILNIPQKFSAAFSAFTKNPGNYLLSPSGIFDLVGSFSAPFTIGGIILGALLGWLLAVRIQYDYDHNEEIKYNDSLWMSEKKFKYRLTPFQRRKRNKLEEQIVSGANFILPGERPDMSPGVAYGINEESGEGVWFTVPEIPRHVIKVGSPGSGKTATTESEIRANAKLGITSILVNMKADLALARKLANYAAEEDINFYHFTQGNPETGEYDNAYNPHGPAFLDPFAGLKPSEKLDIAIGFQKYQDDAQKYKNDVWATLQILLNSLDELEVYMKRKERSNPAEYALIADELEQAGVPWHNGEFRRFCGALMHPEAILNQLPEGNKTGADLRRRILEGASGNIKNSWETPRGNVSIMLNSAYGRWLGLPQNGEPYINFDEIVAPGAKPSIVLLDFNADSEVEVSTGFGKMLASLLTSMSSHRRRDDTQKLNVIQIFFDEFQTIPLTSIAGLLEKARSSNVGISLGQQNLEQLYEKNDPAAVNSLLVNADTLVVLGGMKGGETAKRIVSLVGTKEIRRYKVDSKRERVIWKNLLQWDDNRRYYKSSEKAIVPRVSEEQLINLRRPNPDKGSFYTEGMIIRKTPYTDPITKEVRERMDGTLTHIILPEQVLTKLPRVPSEPVTPPTTTTTPKRYPKPRIKAQPQKGTTAPKRRESKPTTARTKPPVSNVQAPKSKPPVAPPVAVPVAPPVAPPRPSTPAGAMNKVKKPKIVQAPKGTPPQTPKKPRLTQPAKPASEQLPPVKFQPRNMSGVISESVQTRKDQSTPKEGTP